MAEGGSVFASAADGAYGYHLLNLIGSVKANSDIFDRIVVHDLGLSAHQRRLLERVRGIEVREVPPFAEHWAQGFTWKPWIWTHLDAETVFYLDAGATVLRSLGPAVEQIRAKGYFLVSQGNRLEDIAPPDYFELYGIDGTLAARPYVAGGIIGFRTSGAFWERVIVPTYEDCLAGRSLGFSPQETPWRNRGLGYEPSPVSRDCVHFRWDQTVLNMRRFKEFPDAIVADLDEYGGWRSPHDHPRQVIWSHRRPADLRYLPGVPYEHGRLAGRAFGLWYRLRWASRARSRFLRRSTWTQKARRLIADLRRTGD